MIDDRMEDGIAEEEAVEKIGTVDFGESFKVIDYQQAAGRKNWYKINYYGQNGWISASIAEVRTQYADKCREHVGKTIKILNGGIRVRSGPGTGYSQVESAFKGEKYRVLDCSIASDGRHWYKIKVNNIEGWISSNLAEIIY